MKFSRLDAIKTENLEVEWLETSFKPLQESTHHDCSAFVRTVQQHNVYWGYAMIFVAFLALQGAVSSLRHSGQGKGPMFGDFEAQRHWMEVTINLPASEWYVNTTDNDLLYWGLDYPPATAIHSFLLGRLANWINPSWVELHESRGNETPQLKLFMRLTVIVTMCTIYFGSALAYVRHTVSTPGDRIRCLLVFLAYPGLVYIDNGHFQYNHVALGLFVASVALFLSGYKFLGSTAFVIALNFKLMELYHSLPIFAFLVGRSWIKRSDGSTNFLSSLIKILELGAVVIAAFGILWQPFLHDIALIRQVLHRIFPFYRGLFEDKVANFWCIADVVFKFKEGGNNGVLAALGSLSILAILSTVLVTLARRPNARNLKLSLALSSIAFFLLSFQVHEKNILMVAVPALMLLPDYPDVVGLFLDASNLSMFQLVQKDGVPILLVYFAFYFVVYQVLLKQHLNPRITPVRVCLFAAHLGICGLQMFATPPPALPHLFDLLNAFFSYCIFATFALFLFVEFHASNAKRSGSSGDCK